MAESLVDDFLRAAARRFQPGTVKGYHWALSDWERFVDGKDPGAWSAKDIEAWQEEQMERQLSPRSRQLAASAMRSMLKWAARHDRPISGSLWLAVDTVSVPRLLPKPLSPEHLDRLLAHLRPERPAAPITYWRDRALFVYLLTTGARVSEALQMTVDDTATSGVIVRQKGGGSKVLFAPPTAMRMVLQYTARRDDNHPALWVTRGTPEHRVRRLSSEGVREIWIRLADLIGVPRFTTHALRHSCATELSDAGIPDEVIAAQLGHRGTSTLPVYREIRIGRRQAAVDAMEERISVPKLPPNAAGVAFRAGRRRTRLIGGSG